MKVFTYILLGFFLTFILTQTAFAGSTVTVNQTVNSSSSTTSNSSSHCTIHTESNGSVQDYNSDNCSDVHITNGGSTVNINNNSNNTAITPFPTVPPVFKTFPTIVTPTMQPTPTIKIHKEQIKEFHKKLQQQKNFVENLQTWIKNFFSSFRF